MAAGDLENILPTPTAKRTNNITWVDANGVVYPVKEVHWSDANGIGHLIWQRDHSPTSDEYTDVFSSGQILFKYVAKSSNITKLKFWCKNSGSNSNWAQYVYDTTGNRIAESSITPTLGTDVLKVDGSDITVNTYEANVNISVTEGSTYYILVGCIWNTHWYPLAYKDTPGDYWQFTGEDWQLNNIAGLYTAYSDHKIKAEVNGEQV